MRRARISLSRKARGEGRIYRGSRSDPAGQAPTSGVIQPDESVPRWEYYLRKVLPEKLARSFRKVVPWSRYQDTLEADLALGPAPLKRPFCPSANGNTHLPPESLPTSGHASYRASSSSRTVCLDCEPILPEPTGLQISKSPSGELNLASGPVPSTGHASHRASSSCQTLYVESKPMPSKSEGLGTFELLPGELRPDNHVSEAQYIVVGIPGDDPSQKCLVVASLDTQCKKINLMSSDAWDRLKEEGRGVLKSAGGVSVRNLGTERLPVIGVARRLEWQFKNGYRTYIDDFHVVEMQRFDVIIGSGSIYKHGLLKPGADYQHHLDKTAEDDQACIYLEVN